MNFFKQIWNALFDPDSNYTDWIQVRHYTYTWRMTAFGDHQYDVICSATIQYSAALNKLRIVTRGQDAANHAYYHKKVIRDFDHINKMLYFSEDSQSFLDVIYKDFVGSNTEEE